MKIALPLCILLAGCTIDKQTYDLDLDGVPDIDDCAPEDPNIYPGQVESCDQIDNNCNGLVDEEITKTWYQDVDGDGFAGYIEAVVSCEPQPEGASLDPTDCDDTRTDVFPEAPELCDGVDNDCDQQVDEMFWSENFTSIDWDVLKSVGDATTESVGGNIFMNLTPEDYQRHGALWYDTPIESRNWAVRFWMRVSGGEESGEGMTFAWHVEDEDALLGRSGPDLGIYGENVPGFAVEFDNYVNNPRDNEAAGPHIALQRIRTGEQLASAQPEYEWTENEWHLVEIMVQDNVVTVDFDWMNMFEYELPSSASGAYLGFTAATSGFRAGKHSVDNIEYGCPFNMPGYFGPLDPEDPADPWTPPEEE